MEGLQQVAQYLNNVYFFGVFAVAIALGFFAVQAYQADLKPLAAGLAAAALISLGINLPVYLDYRDIRERCREVSAVSVDLRTGQGRITDPVCVKYNLYP